MVADVVSSISRCGLRSEVHYALITYNLIGNYLYRRVTGFEKTWLPLTIIYKYLEIPILII